MKIHFIGIGGIGVSALAQYYLAKGHQVKGSDLVSSEIIDLLKKKGAKVFIGKHKSKNLSPKTGLVIYSPAVQQNNPELKKAKKLQVSGCKLQVMSYPEALGELTKKYFTIAVSGTHGKSTTTAMIALILIKAGLNPTVILGTKLKEFGNSNFRMGKSKYLVIEADEWNASFLNYWPKIIILTNIEKEHLDYYKDMNHILSTYKEFISHLPKEGILVTSKNLKGAEKLRKIVRVPGKHNLSNALLALKTARILKISDRTSFKALSEYKGAWRRFEKHKLKIGKRKVEIISDYAHHPTEIRATLEAAREEFPDKEIWCVFQPHQYQRTFYLFKDFVKVFQQAENKSDLNKLIITDIYDVAGREKGNIRSKTSSKKLVKAVNQPWTIYLPKEKIINYLKKNLKGEEVVIIMGAGDIYKIIDD